MLKTLTFFFFSRHYFPGSDIILEGKQHKLEFRDVAYCCWHPYKGIYFTF